MNPSPAGICVAFVHLRQNILPLFGMFPQALHKANSNLQKHLRNTQVALIMFQDRIDLPHSSSLFIVFSSGLSERYSINSTRPFENTSLFLGQNIGFPVKHMALWQDRIVQCSYSSLRYAISDHIQKSICLTSQWRYKTYLNDRSCSLDILTSFLLDCQL